MREVYKMNELKGTEKQVAWAEDIRAALKKNLELAQTEDKSYEAQMEKEGALRTLLGAMTVAKDHEEIAQEHGFNLSWDDFQALSKEKQDKYINAKMKVIDAYEDDRKAQAIKTAQKEVDSETSAKWFIEHRAR